MSTRTARPGPGTRETGFARSTADDSLTTEKKLIWTRGKTTLVDPVESWEKTKPLRTFFDGFMGNSVCHIRERQLLSRFKNQYNIRIHMPAQNAQAPAVR